MKRSYSKALSLILLIALSFTLGMSSFALSPSSSTLADQNNKVVAENLTALSSGDIDEIFKVLVENSEQRSIGFFSVENSEYAVQLIEDYALKSTSKGSYLSPNTVELQLAGLYPLDFIIYASVSNASYETALSIYTYGSTWWDGNGDAFRHVLWSSTLYAQFVNLGRQNPLATAKMWTNAHEGFYPHQTPNLSQVSLEVKMDLMNNDIGFALAANNAFVVSRLTGRALTLCDTGGAWRIDKVNGKDKLVPTTNSEKL